MNKEEIEILINLTEECIGIIDDKIKRLTTTKESIDRKLRYYERLKLEKRNLLDAYKRERNNRY